MSNDVSKKGSDSSPERSSETRKPESGNLSGQVKIDPKLLKTLAPTEFSASPEGNQDESIGIKLDNGQVANGKNKLTEASIREFETTPPPKAPTPRPLQYEKPPLPSPVLTQQQDILSKEATKAHSEKPSLPSPSLTQQQDTLGKEAANQTPSPVSNPGRELDRLLAPKPHFNLPKVAAPDQLKVPTPLPHSIPGNRESGVQNPTAAKTSDTAPVPPVRPELQSFENKPDSPERIIFARAEFNTKKTELESLALQKITNPKEHQQFLSDMRRFESDFPDRSSKSEVDKQVEMAETYAQISKLLSSDNDVLSRYPQCKQSPGETPWRAQAAQQLMHQAADPTSVDQGVLAVCPTAALQVRQYYRDPSAVARLVTDVLLTGSYTPTTGGKPIDMKQCPDNLIPDIFARKYGIEKQVRGETTLYWGLNYSGIRSFASQIFDVTATNMAMSDKGYKFEQPPYKEAEASRANTQGVAVNKHGERISWSEAIDRKISVMDCDIVTLNQKIIGKRETGFLVLGARLTEAEAKDSGLRKFLDFTYRDASPRFLYSATELGKVLNDIKQSGQWPPIASVNTHAKPFNKKDGGAHYITITGLSNDARKLSFDNTWGKTNDKNGTPQQDTEEFARSIRYEASKQGSEAGSIMPLVNFRHGHGSEWTSLMSSWMDLAEKIKATQMPEAAVAKHNKRMQDKILQLWMTEHPEDKDLNLWHTTLLEWLAKYPDELKSLKEKK